MNTPTHTTTAPVAVAASGPGALAGFEVTCVDCAFVARSSLITIAAQDGREHSAYIAAKAWGR